MALQSSSSFVVVVVVVVVCDDEFPVKTSSDEVLPFFRCRLLSSDFSLCIVLAISTSSNVKFLSDP